MVNPLRVDAAVDLAYGALIALSIVLIATVETNVGVAFGVGVFASYVVHVVWKMARFDPDWMTRTVEETVEESVGDAVEERVGEAVERTVGDRIAQVQERVESVDERVDRRPRADQVADLVDESAADDGRDGRDRS